MPIFHLDGFDDIQKISPETFEEMLHNAFNNTSENEAVVICKSNKRANMFNQAIRGRILNIEGEIATGDKLMVVKNNYFWAEGNETMSFIANGDMAEIRKIKHYDDMYGFRFAERLFAAIEEDYMDIPNRRERYKEMKKNPWFNALQVKFAYALTCHKTQGGQWSSVFIDSSFNQKETLEIEDLRWIYTALTRAQERVYFVNFKDEFFGD